MPRVIDELTPEEMEAVQRIDEEYRPLIDAAQAKFDAAFSAYSKASAAAKAEKRPLTVEESALGDVMSAAGTEHTEITNKWLEARGEIMGAAEKRAVDAYRGNVNAILSMIKEEVPRHIAITAVFAGTEPTEKERAKEARLARKHKKELEAGIAHNEALLEKTPDDAELRKATDELRELLESGAYKLKSTYDMHFSDDALRAALFDTFKQYLDVLQKAAPDAYQEACAFIESCIAGKKSMFDAVATKAQKEKAIPKVNTKTRRPDTFLTPTDRVSNLAFNYEVSKDNTIFYGGKQVPVAIEKKGSRKKIDTLVSIDFDEMEAQGVEITGSKQLTTFDREVHDAVVTLNVEGENEYITPQMIYQTMTGNPEARLVNRQAELISESTTKMMYSGLFIDASQEAAAYGFDSFKYKGHLLPAEKITASINGTVVECLHILRTPPLYDYANRKKQVGRVSIKLLNTPISKTEETATLQGYLLRRIMTIKNPNNRQSPNIVYDTIYKQLEIEAPTDGALRKKKADVRKKIKTILDYWKKEKFIKDYSENKKGQEMYSITIKP